MEKDKNMMVAEDFMKEPPAVEPCCQKKSNGLSELDCSQRNSPVAKPECTIHSCTETKIDHENEIVERCEKKESQLDETKVPQNDSLEEMKSTIYNLRLLLKECFCQLKEERKQTNNLHNRVAELESKVSTYHQIITLLVKQTPVAVEENNLNTKAINNIAPISTTKEVQTKCAKKSTKSFSSAAKVVLSSVKMKHATAKQNTTPELMKQREAEQSLLSTCGDTFNSKAQDMEEELELEGRPSRFNGALLLTSCDNDSATNGTEDVEHHKRKKSQKWRKTGIKLLSTDFRDTF